MPVEILEGAAPKAVAEPEQPATGEPEAAPAAYDIPATQSLADSEKAKILSVLDSVNGNKSKAADILGISRRTIHRKLKEWKIET